MAEIRVGAVCLRSSAFANRRPLRVSRPSTISVPGLVLLLGRLELNAELVSRVEPFLRAPKGPRPRLARRAMSLLLEVFASADAILREGDIDCELQHVFDHAWQQAFEQLARLLQARVRVHFDQPRVELLVEDEVIAEEFEAELAPVRIQCFPHCVEGLQDDFVHLWN